MNNTYGEVYVNGVIYDNTTYPFLVLNPQYFKRGVYFITGILIHEMVHIYCFENNIEDTNYKTGYHNIKFKLACEKNNLKCRKGDYGYNNVVVTPYVKNIVDDILKKIELTNTISKYVNNI